MALGRAIRRTSRSTYMLFVQVSVMVILTSPSYADQGDTQHYRAEGDAITMTRGNHYRQYLTRHNYETIKLALENTKRDFGPFSLNLYKSTLSDMRVLREMKSPSRTGKINLHIAVHSPAREKDLRAIPIPVRGGLLSYRMLVVRKNDVERFVSLVRTEGMKQYRVGTADHWVVTQILHDNGFDTVQFNSLGSMYRMLLSKRFDYVLRGMHELYDEMESFEKEFKELAVVPGIVVFMPLTYHVFVAKNNERLAHRIETGLHRAAGNGTYNENLLHFYGDSIARSALENRKILHVPNAYMAGDPSVRFSNFWFTPDERSRALLSTYKNHGAQP